MTALQRWRRGAWRVAGGALAMFLVTAAARAAGLTAGPMPGAPAMREVAIWLQADGPGEARVVLWPEAAPEARHEASGRLEAGEDFALTLAIGGLEPGMRYRYRVLLDGVEQAGGPFTVTTTPLWQWRTDPPEFELLAGSCNYVNEPRFDRPGEPYGGGYGIFSAMAARRPALMLWLGDNVYLREADYDSRSGLAWRWRHTRSLAALQPLLRATHHVAIWDDHDFGPNNANRSFVLAGESLRLFRRYWPLPAYGTAAHPGAWSVVSWGDVDLFLLDDRSDRDADYGPRQRGRGMFGRAQMRWLENALLASRATFKLVAAGSQLLNERVRKEGWHHFPAERRRFLDWLRRARVPGVVFLSGDRHMSMLLRREREGSYPLYELTCSPLTARPAKAGAADRDNPLLVAGTLVTERNFCGLAFSGPRRQRRMTLRVYAADGTPRWQRSIDAGELR